MIDHKKFGDAFDKAAKKRGYGEGKGSKKIFDLRGAVNCVFDVGEDLGWDDKQNMDMVVQMFVAMKKGIIPTVKKGELH